VLMGDRPVASDKEWSVKSCREEREGEGACVSCLDSCVLKGKKENFFPYSFLSIRHGADPVVKAVSS